MSSDASYDKIKHLVDVDEDILAVFTIDSKRLMENITIDKKFHNENNIIEIIFNFLKNQPQEEPLIDNANTNILGQLKWKILEFEQIRILQISEKDRIVVVLIKSNTSLDETVDNILGYYFEEETIPKSLF